MKIEIKDNNVNIYNNNRTELIYSIQKNTLAGVIDCNGNKVSEWIHQLMDKTWIEKNTLYNLAKLIQLKFPNNNIDWFNTFFMVEKKQYIEQVKQVKDLVLARDSSQTDFDSLFEAVNIGIEENNDFTNNVISKTVINKLEQMGIKTNNH